MPRTWIDSCIRGGSIKKPRGGFRKDAPAPIGAARTDLLFPLSRVGLWKIIKKRSAEIGENFSPHDLRAAAITDMLDGGVSHREVQIFSRHKSVQMVELYDRRRRDLKDAPQKNFPFPQKRSIDDDFDQVHKVVKPFDSRLENSNPKEIAR